MRLLMGTGLFGGEDGAVVTQLYQNLLVCTLQMCELYVNGSEN